MNTVNVYLWDLSPEKQKEVLKASGTTEDDNWELSPLCILEFEDV